MYKILKFNLGRDALLYIIQKYKIQELYIPYYLCDVIRHALVKAGCKPIFYHIDDSFMPDKQFCESDYILYPDYFGICAENVKFLAQKYPRLIVDNAHAYFNKPYGFACFNAGHKFGFTDSILWISDKNNRQACSLFKINPELEKAANLRHENFLKLHEEYSISNELSITNLSLSPFVYPYLAKTPTVADDLVKILNKKGITIYRYWSPLPKTFNEYKFYSRLVPIPVLPVVD